MAQSKRILLALFLELICLYSCGQKAIRYMRTDMEGTVKKGSVVHITNQREIRLNDLVYYKYYDKWVSDTMANISRIIGTPGDTVLIMNCQVFVNSRVFQFPDTRKLGYRVYVRNENDWAKLGAYFHRKIESEFDRVYFLSVKEVDELNKMTFVDSMKIYGADSTYKSAIGVSNSSFRFNNTSFFGPVIIPTRGTKVTADLLQILPMTRGLQIGQELTEDLYFILGDNFHESVDSRVIGLLPGTRISGIVTNYN